MRGENSGKGVHRGERRQRLRPLGNLEFFQASKESAQAQESTTAVGSVGQKRSGVLVSTSRKEQEECTGGRMDLDRWISFRNLVNHWIGQELHEVYHRE
jgi:hypothetical protein